jgi:riboflavin synthase
MFTGLVEETAEVVAMEKTTGGARLHVTTPTPWIDLALGESIAVNGCCLTLATISDTLSFDLLDETLRRTNLGLLPNHAVVNLERALPANGRLGGHFVQGHIDSVGEILGFTASGADHRLEIALPEAFAQYAVFKGSIAVDGISLTVAELKPDSFTLWIIPHTMQCTNLHHRAAGDLVNLEFDLLAKYLERLVNARLPA